MTAPGPLGSVDLPVQETSRAVQGDLKAVAEAVVLPLLSKAQWQGPGPASVPAPSRRDHESRVGGAWLRAERRRQRLDLDWPAG